MCINKRRVSRFAITLPVVFGLFEIVSEGGESLNVPPEGFVALFNGKNLDGWWGAKTEDPRDYMALPPEQLAEKKAASLEDIRQHWRVENGELIIRPVRRRQYVLSELLEGVGPDNLHEEISTGDPVGRESW